MRFFTDALATCIAAVPAMSDLTLTNGECEDRHKPKAEDRRLPLRTREFAKENNVQLCWRYARDVPLHPGDRDLPLAALQAKLTAWLSRHDQETSHLTSILPLVVGMPIRLTENVDRERPMYCRI